MLVLLRLDLRPPDDERVRWRALSIVAAVTTPGLLFVVLIIGTMGLLVLRGPEHRPPKAERSDTGSQTGSGSS